jgi:hypothetical protein
MAPADLPKPRPVPTAVTEPYWEALREERVVLQHCNACGAWVHYPRARCSTCLSADLAWEEVSGQGTVFTFTVTRQATAPAFADEVPQLIAIVELAEGVHVTTTIVDAAPDAVRIGAPVAPVFDHGDDGVTLLRHRLARA